MSNNKQSSVDKVWLILPLIAIAKCSHGKHKLVIGWLTKSYTTKKSRMEKVCLILPLIAFEKCSDGKHELVIGWLTKSYTFKFNNNEQR
jgi:hypothetical protein